MPTLILGIVIFVLLLWGLHMLARADPKRLARLLRTTGGISALAGAVALAATGRFGFAVPLGIAGLALLELWPGMPAGLGRRWNKSPGQASRVRTPFVEMELDHDTGAMHGVVLAGR